MRSAIAGIIAVACFTLASGCTGDGEGANMPSNAPAPATANAQPSAPGPSLSVEADKTHAVQPEDEITVSIRVTGFRLAPAKVGQANEPGVGHYRVYLDNASGDDYLAAGADASARVKVPGDITDGSHDLRVVLFNNDETPVSPPAEARVLLIVYRL